MEGTTPNIITAILEVFSSIGQWFVEFLPEVLAVFWSPTTGLTIIGALAVMALAISVFLLVLNIIQNFMNLRS